MLSWLERAKHFNALPRRDRIELLRMLAQMMAFRMLLVFFGLRTSLAVAARARRQHRPAPDVREVERLAGFARAAARSGLVGSPCLAASLALSRTLKCRGFDTTLHVGVQRRSGGLEAHAWLENQGTLILDIGDRDAFVTIAAFGGARDATK